MIIDKPQCGLDTCKYYFDGNCTNEKRYRTCEFAYFKQLEATGRLIELPCKVGDTVYKLWYKPCHKGEDMPDSYSCCGCEDKCDLERAIFEFVVPSVGWILQHLNAFGDYVWFLTKEEAEAKLAELKGTEE